MKETRLSRVVCQQLDSCTEHKVSKYAGAGWKYISKGRDFHLLHKYAVRGDSVTEFGTFDWNGTWAFIDSDIKKLRCYDIQDFTGSGRAEYEGDPLRKHGGWEDIQKACAENGIDFQFLLEDTAECVIEETDMLFVDSAHNYEQVKAELKNANKVNKYILFHDTVLYGVDGMISAPDTAVGKARSIQELPQMGILRAIDEFLQENEDVWEVVEHNKEGMGMMVVGRKGLTF